jgi:hypothetical protein
MANTPFHAGCVSAPPNANLVGGSCGLAYREKEPASLAALHTTAHCWLAMRQTKKHRRYRGGGSSAFSLRDANHVPVVGRQIDIAGIYGGCQMLVTSHYM